MTLGDLVPQVKQSKLPSKHNRWTATEGRIPGSCRANFQAKVLVGLQGGLATQELRF